MTPAEQPQKLKDVRFNWVPYENTDDGSARFIVHNRIKCNKCGEIIESYYQHDYKTCKCGKTFVDGGHAYMRWGGDDYEDLHETIVLSKQEYEDWKNLREQFFKALKDYPDISQDIPYEWVVSIKAQREYERKVIEELSKNLND